MDAWIKEAVTHIRHKANHSLLCVLLCKQKRSLTGYYKDYRGGDSIKTWRTRSGDRTGGDGILSKRDGKQRTIQTVVRRRLQCPFCRLSIRKGGRRAVRFESNVCHSKRAHDVSPSASSLPPRLPL
ncbi:hypothetical protein BHM03_00021036 [Ensete ventricosum]|nr:hypothetical protein BHM03_00021036 [Ensete ventricosum]